MAVSALCLGCDGRDLRLGDSMLPGRVDHCHGKADRTTPGVIGGFVCSCPCRYGPSELYAQAMRQHPDDHAAGVIRYNELMRLAGHIVPVSGQGDADA